MPGTRIAIQDLLPLPECIHPWLDRFYDPIDRAVLVALRHGPLSRAGLRRRLTLAAKPLQADPATVLERSLRRGVIRELPADRLEPADFHARFEMWALFEGWKDVPDSVRKALNQWELDHYIECHRGQIRTLRDGSAKDPSLVWPEYVLRDEALDLLDLVPAVYLWPCNCRAMMGRCRQSRHTCLRFSNPQGIGWELSRQRAKEIVNQADAAGLMHSAELSLAPTGQWTGALCNCCPDCCYPHQLAKRLRAEKLWPQSRYRARHDLDECIHCGQCVGRCPFQAFREERVESGKTAKPGRRVHFDPDLCRGCGLCAETCPVEAIRMEPLATASRPLADSLTGHPEDRTPTARKTSASRRPEPHCAPVP